MSNESINSLRRIHPLTALAAVSITALSLTGIAAMTGHLGGSHAESAPNAGATTVAAAAVTVPVNVPTASPTSSEPIANMKDKTAQAGHSAPHPAIKAPHPATAATTHSARLPSAAQAAPDPSIGTVTSIDRVDVSSANSGVGAVAGAVVGGVAGHQVGGGRGKDVATVLGAVGGAVAGNAIEKYERKVYRYDVQVRGADGATHTLHYSSPPSFGVGERISLKIAG